MNKRQTITRIASVGAVLAIGTMTLGACSGSSSSGSSSSPSTSGSAVPSVSADPALVAKVPAAIKSTGKLVIGTDASYAPAEFFAENGSTIIGYDVDLGKAIAAKLGLTADFQNATFDSIIPAVENNKYNASMSSFTITPEREAKVNMVSYFSAGTSWAAAKGNPSGISPDNACGKTVAVQKGTVQVDTLDAKNKACTTAAKPAISIQQFSLQTDVSTAVVSGKADAMLADSPVTGYAIKQTGGKLEQIGSVTDTAPQGVVVAKTQAELSAVIQQAIQALMTDGTYKAILDVWGVGSGAITTSELNPKV
ncbi:MAG: ABC transporter substrate-binding protein [Actinomycetes bacterium]